MPAYGDKIQSKLEEEMSAQAEPRTPSAASRAVTFIKDEVIYTLLTTTEDLFEIAFRRGRSIFGEYGLAFFAIWNRAVMFGVFIYFASTNYINLAETQKFVALSMNSGQCAPVGKRLRPRI
jgi:hypothetical protein